MPTKKKSNAYNFPCVILKQGKHKLICFVADAKTIWKFVKVNERDTDKDKGYQRTLSPSRVNTIARYINNGNSIPNSILISLKEGATLSTKEDSITIPKRENAGWVIDGQHRLAGARESSKDIQFAVLAFIGLDVDEQIKQFVIINREAKGVPTSLYLDLLDRIPNKSEADAAKERAVDIADALKKNPESPFYHKIVITPPKRGEMSLTNFVRKVAPLVTDKKGFLHVYVLPEQVRIIDNYFRALKHIFPEYFQVNKQVFFKTLGFGAMINVLATVFGLSLKHYNGFRVEDISKVLKRVEDFDFSSWEKIGTGVQAEALAGDDFRQSLTTRFQELEPEGTSLRL
jgi:DGQHR domain-containing protein